MKNILIITIGTRDVQFTEVALSQAENAGLIQRTPNLTLRNVFDILRSDSEKPVQIKPNTGFDKYYLPNVPRKDGEILADNSKWVDLLTLPLIEAPLEWLRQEVKKIDQVLTVYTDQTGKGVADYHLNNDTVFFNILVHNFLHNHPVTQDAHFDEYCISDEVANIDYQYDHFEQEKQAFLSVNPNEVNSVFLLAQGGIDQINMALTLRLIEHFPGKVRYLHKAEEAKTIERDFPTLFIRNIIRGKAEVALKRYEFGAIEALVDDVMPKKLAQLGVAFRSLSVDRVRQAFDDLFETGYEHQQLRASQHRIATQSEELTKQELLFLSVLIELELEEYNEALWRLRTLGEILLAPDIRNYLKPVDLPDAQSFTDAIRQRPDIEQHLINKPVTQTKGLWYASAFVLRCLFDYQYGKRGRPKELDKAARVLETIGEIRNQLVHSARPVSHPDIVAALQKQKQTLKSVEECLRAYFQSVGLTIVDKGIYDTILTEIKSIL